MQVWALTLLIGTPAAVAGGWFTAILPSEVSAVSAVHGGATPRVDHAGLQVSLARQEFIKLGMPIAPPETVSAAVAGPFKVTQPIDQQLARDLTAVVDQGKSHKIIVIDRDRNNARRTIGVGQEFREGWTVAAIRSQEIVLRHGGEEVTVPMFGSAPATGAPSTP